MSRCVQSLLINRTARALARLDFAGCNETLVSYDNNTQQLHPVPAENMYSEPPVRLDLSLRYLYTK